MGPNFSYRHFAIGDALRRSPDASRTELGNVDSRNAQIIRPARRLVRQTDTLGATVAFRHLFSDGKVGREKFERD